MSEPGLSLGPLLYYWTREQVFEFYRRIGQTDIGVVYLGETVCSKRREISLDDWLELANLLSANGKEVVLSTLALIEAESEIGVTRKICRNGQYRVEANDFTSVSMLAEDRPDLGFVSGPSVNVYNEHTLALLQQQGLKRWVMPVELGRETLLAIHRKRPAGVQTEVFVYGRLPLAYSARCFSARAANRPKDDCRFVCQHDPDGVVMSTREDQPFLVFNGIQTQSAKYYSLLEQVETFQQHGIDLLRVSPDSKYTEQVIRLFGRQLRSHDPENLRQLQSLVSKDLCSGYWHGQPGMY